MIKQIYVKTKLISIKTLPLTILLLSMLFRLFIHCACKGILLTSQLCSQGWYPEIGHVGSIYTTELDSHYTAYVLN